MSGVGTGSNLNGLEVKYQSTTNPQLFLLDNNKVVINKYDPDSTSSQHHPDTFASQGLRT